MGNPFLAVYISSPANLARLETLRQWNLKLADPRGVPQTEIRHIVKEGKAVVLQSMSMHANEIGGTQMAVELIYDLVARTDGETQRILDNVVSIMVPGFNPDGEIMVTDWYNKYVGTEYEGSGYPSLYQKYVGHDNNRDAFMANMVESQYMSKLLFRDWKPEAYVDHHHMGSTGARIFLPPYAEPVRPSADPIGVARIVLVWRAHGVQGRRAKFVGRGEHGRVFRLGSYGFSLDYALSQHCWHVDGIGQCEPRVAADVAAGSAGG